MILLSIEDITNRIDYRKNLEELVKKQAAELIEARKDAEKGKQIVETALSEIIKLKDQLEAERAYLQEEIKLEYNHENMIGQSDGLKYVLYKLELIARSEATVLVLSETEAGKRRHQIWG